MSYFIERFFKLSENKTTVKTEVISGATTFMAMAYILAVQPAIMANAGMDGGAIFTATAICSAIATIFMGLYANLPFALAPGMGTNIFFASTIVIGGVASWEVGLGMVFVAGIIFLLLTVLGLRELIIKSIPKSVRIGVAGAVGIFIASIGLQNTGLMVIADGHLSMGSFRDSTVILSLITIIIAATLFGRKVKGGIFITIIVSTILALIMGIAHLPTEYNFIPPSIEPVFLKLSIKEVFRIEYFPYIFIFFLADFFDTLGTFLAVASKANMVDKDGNINIKKIDRPFFVDACSTVGGALMGLTVVTAYVESSAGIEEGGRTGLTSVVTGALFILSLFLAPIALMIPPQATGGVLVIIGVAIFSEILKLKDSDWDEIFPAILTIFVTAFAGGLGNGVIVAILSYVILKVLMGKYKEVPKALYILSVPLIISFLLK